MAVNGLELITPSSIVVTGSGSSATINAGGSVTFATAATLSLNGVFSSAYDNYVVNVAFTNTTDDRGVAFNLRASGTNATGANYTGQRIRADSTTITGQRTSASTNSQVFHISTTRSGNHLFLYGPNLSQPTAGRSVTSTGTSGGRFDEVAFTHDLSSSYDGFSLQPSIASMTGLIKVYGLAQ